MMNLNMLRAIESAFRALLMVIQAEKDPRLIKAYEKLLEAQDEIHKLLREEQRNERWEEK